MASASADESASGPPASPDSPASQAGGAPPPPDFAARVRAELAPEILVPNLVAGLVVSIIVVIVAVSLATLIFTGELAVFLPQAIGLMLYSGVLITGVVAVASSYPGMVAYPQERVAPILALIAASIVASLTGKVPAEGIFLTVVAAITLASLTNGVFLYLLGSFKLGGLIRFIPYPVIGGFLAGTGWLLVRGSVGVMVGAHLHAADIPMLFQPEVAAKWVPGVVFGAAMIVITRRCHHYLVTPGLLIGAVLAFYAVLLAAGVSAEAAGEGGWLLGPFPESGGWRPLGFKSLAAADWSVLAGQAGNLATILLIAVVSVLLNSGALELAAKTDIDLNRELKAAGAANLLIGLGGGTVGFHSLSVSRLVHQMGARSRVVGLVAAVVCALLLLFGITPLSYLPRLVLGGLLFFLGMHFLTEWVYDAWSRLTRADYAVVVLILACIAALGYLHGVVVGIVACVILFLVNYSRVDVIKHALNGGQQHSNVDRPSRHVRILNEHGEQLYIFKLQGYIFFGTANGLLEQVRSRTGENGGLPLRFMVLEFAAVTGIDSSSILSFVKMRQLAEKHGFTLIFTHVAGEVKRLLDLEGFDEAPPEVFRRFPDLDHALEWCENEILRREHVAPSEGAAVSLREQLHDAFPDPAQLKRLLGYFERVEVEAGGCVMRQGDPSDDLYLIERGHVTANLHLEHESEDIRLRTMCPGTIVGELGFILGGVRTATVTADDPTTLYRLSASAFARMQDESPASAVAFQGFLNRLLAERLVNTNGVIQTLLE